MSISEIFNVLIWLLYLHIFKINFKNCLSDFLNESSSCFALSSAIVQPSPNSLACPVSPPEGLSFNLGIPQIVNILLYISSVTILVSECNNCCVNNFTSAGFCGLSDDTWIAPASTNVLNVSKSTSWFIKTSKLCINWSIPSKSSDFILFKAFNPLITSSINPILAVFKGYSIILCPLITSGYASTLVSFSSNPICGKFCCIISQVPNDSLNLYI